MSELLLAVAIICKVDMPSKYLHTEQQVLQRKCAAEITECYAESINKKGLLDQRPISQIAKCIVPKEVKK
jgi:hypothetical protein